MNTPKQQQNEDQFLKIAHLYDGLMASVPYVYWVGYLDTILAKFGERPRSILDVACGTGNVTELLHAQGYEIVGVDLSEPMIEIAKQKAELAGVDIRYYAQDASKLQLNEKFDLAVSFFDSLNYILEPENLQEAFHRVAEHLNDNRLFIFDLNTVYALENNFFDQKNLKKESDVRYRWKSSYDSDAKISTINMTFWVFEDGEEVEYKITQRQRAYSDGEIRAMLRNAGFELVSSYHGYTLKPARGKTDRIFHVARLGLKY